MKYQINLKFSLKNYGVELFNNFLYLIIDLIKCINNSNDKRGV